MADDILEMRRRLEASRSKGDFKRGEGGIVDVEFAVQMLQLRYASEHPAMLSTNILESISRIRSHKILDDSVLETLAEGYIYLRTIQNRISAIANVSRESLPEDQTELQILAQRMLGDRNGDLVQELRDNIDKRRKAIRSALNRVAESCR